jgi:UDP-3-O-[3-hydroxymyristoyl] glucosamine N-acyltransferase
MTRISISRIVNFLEKNSIKFTFKGESKITLNSVSSIDDPTDYSLMFLGHENLNFLYSLNETNLVIVQNNFKLKDNLPPNLILVDDPQLIFALVSRYFFAKKNTKLVRYMFLFTRIIYLNIFFNNHISFSVKIGHNCSIKNSSISNSVIIDDNVAIGSSGLGSIKNIDGFLVDFPHFGKVIINSNTRISSGSVISRGSLSNTIIGNGCKIGSMSYIGHNVTIGNNVFIGHGTKIAGSVRLHDSVTIWTGSSIRDGVTIGENSIVGMGSNVLGDIPPNEIWVGNPAKFLRNI